MAALLPDHDIRGQFRALLRLWLASDLIEFWTDLKLSFETFASLQLPINLPDAELWRFCQSRGLILMTGNRNEDDPDSLEATIQAENTPISLPVLTISAPEQILVDREYAHRVAEKVIDYVSDLDTLLGTGRLFVP